MLSVFNAAITNYFQEEKTSKIKLAADHTGVPIYGPVEFSICSVVASPGKKDFNSNVCLTSNLSNNYTINFETGEIKTNPTPLLSFNLFSSKNENTKIYVPNHQNWFLSKYTVDVVKFQLLDLNTQKPIDVKFTVHFVYRKR